MANESALFEDDFTVDLDDLASPTAESLTDELEDFVGEVVPVPQAATETIPYVPEAEGGDRLQRA